MYTFICLVSQFNTLELFCLPFNSILFYSIPLYIFYELRKYTWIGETFQNIYIVLFAVPVYTCNRQDKGKCCIVLSFISPFPLFRLFCALFFIYILFVCKTSLKYEVSLSVFFTIDFFFFLVATREDFFVKK